MGLTQQESGIVRALVHVGLKAREISNLLNERFRLAITINSINGNVFRQGLRLSKYPKGDRGTYAEDREKLLALLRKHRNIEGAQAKIERTLPHLLTLSKRQKQQEEPRAKTPAKSQKPPRKAVAKRTTRAKKALVQKQEASPIQAEKRNVPRLCAAKDTNGFCWQKVVPGHAYCQQHLGLFKI